MSSYISSWKLRLWVLMRLFFGLSYFILIIWAFFVANPPEDIGIWVFGLIFVVGLIQIPAYLAFQIGYKLFRKDVSISSKKTALKIDITIHTLIILLFLVGIAQVANQMLLEGLITAIIFLAIPIQIITQNFKILKGIHFKKVDPEIINQFGTKNQNKDVQTI